MGSSRSRGSTKERLRWTDELHDQFVQAVNHLGGPDIFPVMLELMSPATMSESLKLRHGATPRGIMKAMDVPGVNIYHVKSHLQKYRISKFVKESVDNGKFERRSVAEMLPNFGTISGAQLKEALQHMQMDLQRRLSDKSEVQRSLKFKIEAQGRFLERISGEQQHCKIPTRRPLCKPLSLTSLPPLTDEVDDYKGGKTETGCNDQEGMFLRAPKRARVEEKGSEYEPSFYNYSSLFFPKEDSEVSSFILGVCQSPLIPGFI